MLGHHASRAPSLSSPADALLAFKVFLLLAVTANILILHSKQIARGREHVTPISR